MGVMVMDFTSGMGHSRSDLVGLLVMDSSIHIGGIDIVLKVLRDSANSTENGLISWIEHMELNYDMIILLYYILYLYCIHNHFVKRRTIIYIAACDL